MSVLRVQTRKLFHKTRIADCRRELWELLGKTYEEVNGMENGKYKWPALRADHLGFDVWHCTMWPENSPQKKVRAYGLNEQDAINRAKRRLAELGAIPLRVEFACIDGMVQADEEPEAA